MMSSARTHRHVRGRRTSSASTSRATTSTVTTKNTRSSGAYNSGFEQRIVDSHIYPHGYEYPDGRVPLKPKNWHEMKEMLLQRRPSLSPTLFPDERFEDFARAGAKVSSENKVTHKVLPLIQGEVQDERCVGGDTPLINLADIMSGKSYRAKPDLYYGARPEQLDRRVRDELGAYVIPSTLDHRACAPNFFVEAKGPSGSAKVCLNQACVAGALGERGMHALRTYSEAVPFFDNDAHTISTTYHAGQLKLFSHHVSQPNGPGTQPA